MKANSNKRIHLIVDMVKMAMIIAISCGLVSLIVFAVSLFNERGICLRQELRKKPTLVRWAVWYAVLFYILIFGAYGQGYIPVDPMYANF